MANPPNIIREMVSGQRIRFIEDGYNLDLSYIGDRIIAMGYPADNVEAIYRNKREDVVKFLKEKHPGCCKVYNLCSERAYDATLFQHYAEYPFKDHNPPDIELINKFCEDVNEFLRSDSRHVVAIHCKAGKGRTGTMICCYLLYSNAFQTANEALTYYAEKRTKDKKGVTIPSQRRYVEYYEQLLRGKPGPYQDVTLYICEIRISPADVPLKSGTIKVKGSKEAHPLTEFQRSEDYVTVQLNFCLPLTGDVKIEFARSKLQDKRWHFWFNTFFVERAGHYDSQNRLVLSLTKKEIDDAHKGKTKKCPEQVIVFLRPVPSSERKNGEKQSSANRELSTIPTTQQAPLVDSGNQNHHHHYYSNQQQQQQRHHHAQMEPITQSQQQQQQQQHRSSVNNRSSMGSGQQNSCIYGNIGHPDNGGLLSIAKPMGMKQQQQQQQQQQQAVYATQQPDAASASSPTRKLSYKNQQSPAVNKMPHKAPQQQQPQQPQHLNHSGGSSEEISGTDSVEESEEEEEEEEEGWESGPTTGAIGPLAPAQPPNRAEAFSYHPSSPPLAGPDDGAIALPAVKKSPLLTGGVINRTLKKVTHQLERFNHRTLFGLMGGAKCKQDDSAAACRSDGPLNGGPVAEARPSETAADQCPTRMTLSESELKIRSLREALTATEGQQQPHHQAPPLHPLALDRSSSSGQLRPSHHDSSLGLMSSDASLATGSSSATSSSRSIRDPVVLGGGRRGPHHDELYHRQQQPQPHLEYRGGKAATAAQQAFRYGPRTGSIDYSSLLSFSADALERRQRFTSGIPSRDRTVVAVGCGGVIGCEPRCHETCGNGRADIEQKRASGKACGGGGGGHLTDSGRSSTEINSSELETPSSSSKHSDDDEQNITLT